ncbi:hypothetical protein [Thermus thalpophilus]|nr:hypothetical protein [Thermus thalpophilus]
MCALLDQAKGILEDWLRGLLTDREALEAIFQAARENNFPPESEEES